MARKIERPFAMKRTITKVSLGLLLLLGFTVPVLACDFSPSVTANNLVDNGDGTFSFDVLMCVGERGSENGPVIFMNGGLNILETSAPELINPYTGGVAEANITGGTITYSFDGLPGQFWVADDGEFGPCFSFTLTVDGDPSAATVSIEEINTNCLNEFSGTWTSTISADAPGCNADFTVFAPVTISGNTNGAGNDCNFRPSDDQTIEVIVLCDGFYTFSTCDSTFWDTWIYLSTDCCSGLIVENDDVCGAQSEVSAYLPAGTYYITVEGFFDFNDGEYTLIITEGDPPQKAETGPDQNICENFTTISATTPGFGVGQWSVLTGNGVIQFPDSATTEVTNLSNGLNQFVYTIFNGDCEIDSDTINVIANGDLMIVCPDDITVNADPATCEAVVNYDPPTGSSECSTIEIVQIAGLGSGSSFPIGTTIETWLVTDTLGNSDSCSFSITVVDTVPPVVVCPEDVTVGTDEGFCSAVVEFDEPQIESECPVASIEQVGGLPSGSEFPLGNTTIVYQIIDGSGNEIICAFDIIVEDVEPPVLECPEDIIIELEEGECFTNVVFDLPVATDNCPGVGAVFQTEGLASGDIFPAGTTVQEFQVSDAAGNTTTCTFSVTVLEIIPPEIVCPENIVVNVDPDECGAVVDYVPPFGTDNCPGAITTIIDGLPPGSFFPVGTTTVAFEVVDASGNTAQCGFTITVVDDIAPEITCPDDIVVDNDPGECGANVNFPMPTGSDNCDDFTITLLTDIDPGGFFPVGTTGVVYQIEDAAGNTATCTFNVTVNDVEAPQPNCGDIVTENDPGLCSAVVDYPEPTASDNCDNNDIVVEQISGPAPGSTFQVGSTTVVWSFTDQAGNQNFCEFSIIVNDTEDPTFADCPEDEVIILPEGDCTTELNYEFPTAEDNCPGVTVELVSGPAPGTTVPAGEHTVIIEAEDAAGNTATCSFTITVVETVPPTIECPEDIIAYASSSECGANVDYEAPVGEDNCPGAVTTLTNGVGPGGFFPVGTNTETWTVTDLSGNTAECSFTITVLDTIAPVVDCPNDIVVDANTEDCTAIVNYPEPTATDNCDDNVTIELISGPASGSEFVVGVTTIVYQVTDESGNVTICEFTVTVIGESDPSITCPGDIVVSNDPDTCGAFVDYPLPVAEDACGGDVTIELNAGLEPGAFFPLGATTITYTATNTLGNTATCSFVITVVDEEDPVITCPEDITITATEEQCEFEVEYDLPIATDNCEVVAINLIEGEPSGSTFDIGVHTITYEAVDASGNTATCSFTITIIDEIDPTITDCPSDITVTNDEGVCGAVINYEEPVGDDNCDFTLSLTSGLESGATFPVGSTTVTWTVTDNSGNTASCSFVVTVTDDEAPVIDCPGNIETCEPEVNWNINATDNCELASLTQTEGPGPGATFPIGTTTITYEAVDASGNTSTCTFTVTVEEDPDAADAGPDQLLCDGNETTLEANNPGEGVGFWEIVSGSADISDPNDPNATVSNIEPGELVLSWTVIGGDICPSTTDFVTIIVESEGGVNAGPNVTIGPGESADLEATGSPEGGTYEWSPATGLSCSDCPNPVATPTVTTTYTVTYTSENGCRYEDQVTVTVFFEIPSGFTPDDDGTNDVWNIPGVTPNTEVMIYNRWGNKIFESVGYNDPWDGTYNNQPLPVAAYYYVIDFKDGSEPQVGTVTIIR